MSLSSFEFSLRLPPLFLSLFLIWFALWDLRYKSVTTRPPSGLRQPRSFLFLTLLFLSTSNFRLSLSRSFDALFLNFFWFVLFALCVLFYMGFFFFNILLLLFGVWFYLPYVFSFMCLAMESYFEHNNRLKALKIWLVSLSSSEFSKTNASLPLSISNMICFMRTLP